MDKNLSHIDYYITSLEDIGKLYNIQVEIKDVDIAYGSDSYFEKHLIIVRYYIKLNGKQTVIAISELYRLYENDVRIEERIRSEGNITLTDLEISELVQIPIENISKFIKAKLNI